MEAMVPPWIRAFFLTGLLCAASPIVAQPYPGPPADGRTYWEVPAFKEHPYAGPEKARGLIIWSHGLNGKNPQWQGAPPDIIRDAARAGWDVMKVNRNSLHETSWIDSGRKHVAHVVSLGQKAKAGSGQITLTSYTVPKDSLGWWQEHLTKKGVPNIERYERFGQSIMGDPRVPQELTPALRVAELNRAPSDAPLLFKIVLVGDSGTGKTR
jgi:hypothetical protein